MWRHTSVIEVLGRQRLANVWRSLDNLLSELKSVRDPVSRRTWMAPEIILWPLGVCAHMRTLACLYYTNLHICS